MWKLLWGLGMCPLPALHPCLPCALSSSQGQCLSSLRPCSDDESPFPCGHRWHLGGQWEVTQAGGCSLSACPWVKPGLGHGRGLQLQAGP